MDITSQTFFSIVIVFTALNTMLCIYAIIYNAAKNKKKERGRPHNFEADQLRALQDLLLVIIQETQDKRRPRVQLEAESIYTSALQILRRSDKVTKSIFTDDFLIPLKDLIKTYKYEISDTSDWPVEEDMKEVC